MYGGSILPGRFKDKDVTVQDVFEAVGARKLVTCQMKICMSLNMWHAHQQVHVVVNSGKYNGCVSEAIGLALPESAGAPAPYETRDEYAYTQAA